VRLRGIAALAAFAMGLLVIAGCSGDNAESSSAPGAGSAAGSGDGSLQPAAAAPGQAAGGTGAGEQNAAKQGAPAQRRHVMHTATLHVRVDDVGEAAAGARGVAGRFGGFVADERTESETANLTLKVAVDRLDDALAAVAELGQVTHREQQAEDVTEQVVDVETRIANQRASVDRVRALLDRATTVGEVVQVESELTRRQAELESLENRATALAGQTELATVTVRLAGRGSAGLDGERSGFLTGLRSGWDAFVVSVTVFLTVLGAILPFVLALGIPVLAVRLAIRRRRAATRPAGPASTSD